MSTPKSYSSSPTASVGSANINACIHFIYSPSLCNWRLVDDQKLTNANKDHQGTVHFVCKICSAKINVK